MLEGVNGLNQIGAGTKSSKSAKTSEQKNLNSVFEGQQTSNKLNVTDDLDSKILGGRSKKIVTTINDDGSKTEKSYDKDGKLFKETIYKDINGDGKEDIYSVTNHYEAYDDPVEKDKRQPAVSTTYVDEDGDGYYDTYIKREYDDNGKLKSETKHFEEDINEVKKRDHMPWEVHNRSMDAHNSGVLIN